MVDIGVIRNPPEDEAEWIVKFLKEKAKVVEFHRKELSSSLIEKMPEVVVRWDSVDEIPIKLTLPFLELIEASGRTLINSTEIIRKCENKALTAMLLRKHNVPTPPFALVDSVEAALREAERIGYPIVLKPYAGSGGSNVVKAKDAEQLKYLMELFLSKHCYYDRIVFLQRYIEKPGRDIRVIVAGDEVAGSYARISKNWVTSVRRGGKPKVFSEPEIEELSLKAAEALGEGVVGIDIAESSEEAYILEVNHKPGYSLYAFPSFEKKVARKIADYILRKAKR